MVTVCAGAVVAYVALTVTIPLEVKEPLEILNYPSHLSCYPGETIYFDVTLRDNSQLNYTVNLIFSIDNKTYLTNYLIFNKADYLVHPGTQNLNATLEVSPSAPATSTQLSVQIDRTFPFMGSSSITITDVTFLRTSGVVTNYVNITMKNTGTKVVTISLVKVNNVAKTVAGTLTLAVSDVGKVIRILNVGWSNGSPYKIGLYDSNGSVVGSAQYAAPGS